jgi:hypothetical protein
MEPPPWKTQLSLGSKEFFNDLMVTRLNPHSRVGNRELRILSEDVKEDVDEPASKCIEQEHQEARDCDGNRLQLPAGFARLYSQSSKAAPGTASAARLWRNDHP